MFALGDKTWDELGSGCLIPKMGFLSGQKNLSTLLDLGFERFRSSRFKKGGFFFGPIFVRIRDQSSPAIDRGPASS